VKLPSNRAVEKHRAKVLVRFFARGGHRGFVCKFDKHRYRRCHSPKRYRVHVGRHVFKVRAIGVTGLRGPVASAVIHITKPCSFGGHQLASRPKLCGSSVDKESRARKWDAKPLSPAVKSGGSLTPFVRFKTDPLPVL
jgi:hypothetical protein